MKVKSAPRLKRVRWSVGGLPGMNDSFPTKKTLFADVEKSGNVNVSVSIDHLDKLFI